jgi:hypothetical protein
LLEVVGQEVLDQRPAVYKRLIGGSRLRRSGQTSDQFAGKWAPKG